MSGGKSSTPAAEVVITSARVVTADGRTAAEIDRVDIGGGTQTVTVDGTAEERVHPASSTFHVRLIAPDRMLSDELREAADFDAAVELGRAYAAKLVEHAGRVAELADDLKV